MTQATRILSALAQGDQHAADQILPLVYDELRRLAVQRLARETDSRRISHDRVGAVTRSNIMAIDPQRLKGLFLSASEIPLLLERTLARGVTYSLTHLVTRSRKRQAVPRRAKPAPPGPCDPNGVHAAVWSEVEDDAFCLPADKPLTLVAYECDPTTRALIEPVAVGDVLPDMPLFLEPNGCV